MATIFETDGDDDLVLQGPGVAVVDFLGGFDTLDMNEGGGASQYRITKGTGGAVLIDSISNASGGGLHLTVYNLEQIIFPDTGETIDLTTYFGVPPTVTITDNVPGTATGNVTYTLAFSEAVTGLTASALTVSNGSVVSVSGSGASYSVVVAPAANTEGVLGLTLKAGAVNDSASLSNAATTAAAQPIDTKPPTQTAFSPANHATGVAVDGSIVVTYSEAIQRGSGSILLHDASGAVVATYGATSSSVTVSGSTLSIHPATPLAWGASYSLEFAADSVRDLAGNAYAGSVGYGYTTTQTLTGTAGNDVLKVASGLTQIDGQAGIDSVVFTQPQSAYVLTQTASGYTVAAKDGSQTLALSNVERLQFADTKLALDLNGNAGEVAKILGAVFGPATITAQPDYVGIGLQFADSGMSYTDLMQLALNVRLGAGATHKQVVDLLYTNVVGTAPPPGDEAFYVGLLDSNTNTPATLGTLAADTGLNQARVDLVGLAHTGMVYIGG